MSRSSPVSIRTLKDVPAAAKSRQPPEQIPKHLAAVDIHAALVCPVADPMPYQPFPSLPHK